jgi:hypothetical protein
MKYLLFIVLLVGTLITAGCFGENKTSVDPIVGIWVVPDVYNGTTLGTLNFFADGRIIVNVFNFENAEGTWIKIRENEYSVPSGGQSFIYDPKTDTIAFADNLDNKFYRPGIHPATTLITIAATQTPVGIITTSNPTVPVEETETTGSVMVYSNPNGASILIDGNYLGTTPGKVSGIPAGNHILRLTMSGYYDYEGSVYVVPGQTTQGYGTLQPMSQVTSAVSTQDPIIGVWTIREELYNSKIAVDEYQFRADGTYSVKFYYPNSRDSIEEHGTWSNQGGNVYALRVSKGGEVYQIRYYPAQKIIDYVD